MEITLIRHTAVAQQNNLCYGHLDVPLADTFAHESTQIASCISDKRYDRIVSSPSIRCRLLAEKLAGGQPFDLDPRLMELNFGLWEGKSWDAIYASALGKTWFDNYLSVSCPSGESYTDLRRRAACFLDEIQQEQFQSVLIISHAGWIRAAIGLLTGKFQEAFDRPIGFGEIIYMYL